jgi:hypothetical protein
MDEKRFDLRWGSIMRGLLFIIVVSFYLVSQTGCRQSIPPSAEPLLLRCLHAEKIVKVSEVRRRAIDGFDYTGIGLTVEVTWGFESWYHPAVIMRKPQAATDWGQADLFSCETLSIEQAFELSEPEFLKHLHPWPCEEER